MVSTRPKTLARYRGPLRRVRQSARPTANDREQHGRFHAVDGLQLRQPRLIAWPGINTPCKLTMQDGQRRPEGESASGEAGERHGNNFQGEAPATDYATDCNLAKRVCSNSA